MSADGYLWYLGHYNPHMRVHQITMSKGHFEIYVRDVGPHGFSHTLLTPDGQSAQFTSLEQALDAIAEYGS